MRLKNRNFNCAFRSFRVFFYIDFISKQCLFLNLGFKRTRTHYNGLTFASWYICLYFSLTNLLQTKGHGAKVTVVCKEGLAMDPVLGPRLDNPTKQNDKARPLSKSFTPVSYYAGMWIKSNFLTKKPIHSTDSCSMAKNDYIFWCFFVLFFFCFCFFGWRKKISFFVLQTQNNSNINVFKTLFSLGCGEIFR